MIARCSKCVWFYKGKCLLKDIRVIAPNLPRRCPYYDLVPEMAKNYLAGVSKVTELDTNTIKDSEPFKNYLKKLKLVKLNELVR